MKEFNIDSRITGARDFGLAFPDSIYSARLAMGSDVSVTVPGDTAFGVAGDSTTNRYLAVISYVRSSGINKPLDVWVALNDTAAEPAGATFAATTSELNPSARYVKAGDVIHFYAVAANIDVAVSFYSLSE
jgi:hypothetical protein